jgi:hypothetical protein
MIAGDIMRSTHTHTHTHTIGHRSILVMAAGVALAMVGCAATTSKVRVDKGTASLNACRSFDWLDSSTAPASFTDQRVKAATLAALGEKGYTQSTDKPDCKITYLLSSSERPKPKPGVGVGVGGGSGGLGGGLGISLPIGRKSEGAGTFTLDIIDASRNAQIWSGSLDAQFKGAEPSEEESAAIVKKILAEFPNRG